MRRWKQLMAWREYGAPASSLRIRLNQRWIVGIAATALIAASGAAWATRDDDKKLRPTDPTTVYAGPLVDKTGAFHMTPVRIDHPGKTITVLEVEALTSPNVEYLGAVVIWPGDLVHGNVGVSPSFPPRKVRGHHALGETASAVDTMVVPPKFGEPGAVSVVAGFRFRGDEVGAVNGFRVVYKVGGKKIIELVDHAAIVCPESCKKLPGWRDSDFAEDTLARLGLMPDDE